MLGKHAGGVGYGMKCSFGPIVLATLLHFADGATRAQTPAIGMTFDDFRKALDEKIREDTTDKTMLADTTAACTKTKDTYVCTFHDAGFRRSVAAFEKLGVLSDRFVSRISLAGDRSDPVNLFQFYGTVVNVMQISDPEVGQ
jgi:hypothetical protein